jgi:hypothetical protein
MHGKLMQFTPNALLVNGSTLILVANAPTASPFICILYLQQLKP